MNKPAALQTRRTALARAAAWLAAVPAVSLSARAQASHPDGAWYRQAEAMKKLAESWGDQSYGAVLVFDGMLAGQGPSRVVKDNNPDAHAERVAIADAQRRLGRRHLQGAVLYSTSRPCRLCEGAAADAGVARMYHGPALTDAGPPRHARE